MVDTEFDVVIIGGGPGGYVAAIRAAQLGMRAAVVEREHLGGICLNWGCIPTKTLLHAAEFYQQMTRASTFGIRAEGISFDIGAMVRRSRKIALRLNKGISYLLKKNKVSVFDGRGQLTGSTTRGHNIVIISEGKEVGNLTAQNVVLATGARARGLKELELDGNLVWTYKEAMVPEVLPKSLLVVGSGAIGIEFASFYRDLGVDVTVVEILPRILPIEDEEISDFALKAFKKQGMVLHTAASITDVKKGVDTLTVTINAGDRKVELTVERAILAVGITGNIEELGLDCTNVRVDKGHVLVNEWGQTDEKGIYAIGDVAGAPWLAHKASHEGMLSVERIANISGTHPLDVGLIPGCTYCRPQIASVGLTETAAREKGYQIRVGRFPFAGNGKAIALGESEGLVKTVFDAEKGTLLGAHMVGAGVTELIQGYVTAMTLKTTEADLIRTIFPHPTISEAMHEAVLDAYGRAIHL